MVHEANEQGSYPVEASMSGKNAYYHFCHIRSAKQNYAVCLHILNATEEQRVKRDDFVDCQRACLRGDCEAKRMREEEIAAGRALYYTPREIRYAVDRPRVENKDPLAMKGPHNMSNPSYARGWHAVGQRLAGEKPTKQPSKSPAPTPIKKKPGYVQENFAELVNVIATDKPKPTPEPAAQSKEKAPSPAPSALKPLPGETPLQFAQRRARALQGA